MNINELLEATYKNSCSDLHLMVGFPPMLRTDGVLNPVGGKEVLTGKECKELVLSLLSDQQKDLFLVNKEIDFSFSFGDKGRFRINAYYEKGNVSAALRLLPHDIPTIDELNLPKIYHKFSELRNGFILVTGPTGHGKSTTLAAIIEEINKNRKEHIITIEDPIEYVYEGKESIISQRELHADTHSWEIALRSVLREDPNVVLVGEMRDYETIAAALTIAETGHLVFATLHTNSAAQTLDRIVDVFPEHQQAQVRMQLSNTLEAVLSQRLLPALDGGRIPCCEVLLATPAVKATVREGKSHLIDNIIQTSTELGMMTLEMSLASWVKEGKISMETAIQWSLRPEQLSRLIKGKA
ncbi:type IV pilus twitching motility protein PilT [Patescibacteria group bacterium]